MKRILLFAAGLLFVSTFLFVPAFEASPLDGTARSKPAPRAKKPGGRRNVLVQSIEPKDATPGQLITILGTGFDQGTAILLGSFSPSVVEQTEGKIVFRAPATDPQHSEGIELPLFLVTPGFPLTNPNVTLRIAPPDRKAVSQTKKVNAKADIAIEETVAVSAAQARPLEFDFNDGRSAEISLQCTGGEVELRLEGGDPALASVFATWNGTFEKRLSRAELLGSKKEPSKGHVRLTLATDSKTDVPCHIRIARFSAPQSAAPAKTSARSPAAK